jgi:hypothetical protein
VGCVPERPGYRADGEDVAVAPVRDGSTADMAVRRRRDVPLGTPPSAPALIFLAGPPAPWPIASKRDMSTDHIAPATHLESTEGVCGL